MEINGNRGLVQVVLMQLNEIIKNYPLISGIEQIDIENNEECSSYFIRLQIPLKSFEKKIPIYNKDSWELFKNRQERHYGGLFFYTSELEKWSKDPKFVTFYKISNYIEEALEYVGYPVCVNTPGLVSYILV